MRPISPLFKSSFGVRGGVSLKAWIQYMSWIHEFNSWTAMNWDHEISWISMNCNDVIMNYCDLPWLLWSTMNNNELPWLFFDKSWIAVNSDHEISWNAMNCNDEVMNYCELQWIHVIYHEESWITYHELMLLNLTSCSIHASVHASIHALIHDPYFMLEFKF